MSTDKKEDKKVYRKDAAPYVNHTVRTLGQYDYINKKYGTREFDFKPQKDQNGRVYYFQSVLTEYRERRLKPKR